MFRFTRLLAAVLLTALAAPLVAQSGEQSETMTPIQTLLQEHRALIEKSSRKTIAPAIDALASSGLTEAQTVLERWQAKELWQRKDDKLFFLAEKDGKSYVLRDITTGADVGTYEKKALKQLKPNSGVRAMIGAALVRFQLTDPDPARRTAALEAIARDAEAAHLAPLRAAIDGEEDPALKAQKIRQERLLTIRFDEDEAARVAAIDGFSGDLGVDIRATLNPLLATTRHVVAGEVPDTINLAAVLTPGTDALSQQDAYAMLVAADLAPARIAPNEIRVALAENIDGGAVGGVPIARLNTDAARAEAYSALAAAGVVPVGTSRCRHRRSAGRPPLL